MYASPLNPEAPSMMSDYEPYDGRKSYAEETAGGFYAARLAIAEKLKEIKRQASVLALRFITEAYEVPLGVFVVREAARKAMQNRPITFSSLELMETYAKHYISRKFNISFDAILRESQLLAQIKHQQKLSDFG
ncbi:hypothetical protein HYU13_06725 [Candidatus Woesearchaeota archaeon]|nr:hypothetical protein [Candidatus Woesearchaeota archaeon]